MTAHRSPLDQRLAVLVAAWSVLATALGTWWLAEPGGYPFGPGDEQRLLSLLSGLPAGPGSFLLVGAGVVGTAAATAHALRRRPAPAGLVGLAALYAAVFVLVVPDVQLLIVLGYGTALLLPLGVLPVLAATLRTPRPALVATGALAFLVVVLAVSGTLDAGALSRFAQSIGSGFLNLGTRPLKVLFLAVGGVLWGVLAVSMQRERTGRCTRCGRPGAAWSTPAAAARWGRAVTLGAAACALPYGVLRMTWLTPWPQGVDPQVLVDTPGVRLMGLLLGAAALGGAVLTLGLIRPWGETWPRWVPGLRGRPVPLAAAVVPGAVVSLSLAVAGLSIARMMIAEHEYAYLVVFPFVVWAPLLAAATYAYYLRRRGPCRLERWDGAVSAGPGAPAATPERSRRAAAGTD